MVAKLIKLKLDDTNLYGLRPFDNSIPIFMLKYEKLDHVKQKQVRAWLKDKKKELTIELDKLNLQINEANNSKNNNWIKRQVNKTINTRPKRIQTKEEYLKIIFSLEIAIYWGVYNSQTWYSTHTYVTDCWYSKFVTSSFDDGAWFIRDFYIFKKIIINGNLVNDPREEHVHFYLDSEFKLMRWHYKIDGKRAVLPNYLANWVHRYRDQIGRQVNEPKTKSTF